MVHVILCGPNVGMQTQALLNGASNTTLLHQDIAEELGLLGQ